MMHSDHGVKIEIKSLTSWLCLKLMVFLL